MVVESHFGETSFPQCCLKLLCSVALHPINDLFKLLAGLILAVRLIADQEKSARLQNVRYLCSV